VTKLVRRVKLVTELQAGEAMAVEVARIERDEQPGLADLGLRLEEAKQLTSALQAEIVPARLARVGWPARDITPPHSARCSVTLQYGFGACSPVPARIGAWQRASPRTTSRLRPWRPNWPM